jgi:hypothetical protein
MMASARSKNASAAGLRCRRRVGSRRPFTTVVRVIVSQFARQARRSAVHPDSAERRIPPVKTVRVRLTALYSGLFLATSTILLVTVDLLLRSMLEQQVSAIENGAPPPQPLPAVDKPETYARVRRASLQDQVVKIADRPPTGTTVEPNIRGHSIGAHKWPPRAI